ncbi:hypothetical protein GUITHDRAFT_141568 [Guillardia theta CCMP2712]|uniref:3'-5' exonuclease n=1 Tax=Guillardia theta (strain CCMP2712) TaxID=905079 RepID=L1J0R3_GUITC|nr:hypothetical protein GUITHDRAFT_141568 [Guillardia theta CCMP2712]EKX42101.1 hypothetical protein GUITHDRAFT_141568 [Guillardia theta CCMP2712]|eukprot:XP_005829081.1 hypothetical protein GUITHDRAFT_141568 [Guillardia theta CCMP2712]
MIPASLAFRIEICILAFLFQPQHVKPFIASGSVWELKYNGSSASANAFSIAPGIASNAAVKGDEVPEGVSHGHVNISRVLSINSEDLFNKLLSSRGMKAGEKLSGEGSSQRMIMMCFEKRNEHEYKILRRKYFSAVLVGTGPLPHFLVCPGAEECNDALPDSNVLITMRVDRMNDWVMLVVTKKRVVELQIHVTNSSAHVDPVVRLHVCGLNAAKQVENWIRKRVFDRKCSTVGVDMEWKPVFSAGHYSKVSLIQISTRDDCILYHIHHSAGSSGQQVPPALRLLFQDTSIRKDWGCDILGRVDLAEFAAALGHIDLTSLKKITEHFLSVKMCKAKWLTMGNWEKEALNPEQVAYASMDAWAAVEVLHAVEEEIVWRPSVDVQSSTCELGKFFSVRGGKRPGVYMSKEEAKKHVEGGQMMRFGHELEAKLFVLTGSNGGSVTDVVVYAMQRGEEESAGRREETSESKRRTRKRPNVGRSSMKV